MDRMVVFEGQALQNFLDGLALLLEARESVYHVAVVVDREGLKMRLGGSTWSPPQGEVIQLD